MKPEITCCRCPEEAKMILKVGKERKPYCYKHYGMIKSKRLAKKEVQHD